MKHIGQSPGEEPNTELPPVFSPWGQDTITLLAIMPNKVNGVLLTREAYPSLVFRAFTGAPSFDCLHG